jgi:hypothetical protein
LKQEKLNDNSSFESLNSINTLPWSSFVISARQLKSQNYVIQQTKNYRVNKWNLIAQNKDTQKVDLARKANCCHAMIRHQNADAMVLSSTHMRGILSPPLGSAILNIIRG